MMLKPIFINFKPVFMMISPGLPNQRAVKPPLPSEYLGGVVGFVPLAHDQRQPDLVLNKDAERDQTSILTARPITDREGE